MFSRILPGYLDGNQYGNQYPTTDPADALMSLCMMLLEWMYAIAASHQTLHDLADHRLVTPLKNSDFIGETIWEKTLDSPDLGT